MTDQTALLLKSCMEHYKTGDPISDEELDVGLQELSCVVGFFEALNQRQYDLVENDLRHTLNSFRMYKVSRKKIRKGGLSDMDKTTKKPETVTEFFDPYNVEHLKAYDHLCQTGSWPKGFLPEGIAPGCVGKVEVDHLIEVVNNMANAWMAEAKAGRIFGMPHFDQ